MYMDYNYPLLFQRLITFFYLCGIFNSIITHRRTIKELNEVIESNNLCNKQLNNNINDKE